MDGETVLAAALAQVADAAEVLRAAGSGLLDDVSVREGVRELDGLITTYQHIWLGLVAELDRRPEAVPGSRAGSVAKSFLGGVLNKTSAQAGRDVKAARALETDALPMMGAAFSSGSVSREHLDVAVACVAKVPKPALDVVGPAGLTGRARIDGFLTEHAKAFDPKQLRNLSRHLVAVLDPDGAEQGYDPEAWRRRGLSITTAPDGMVLIRGQVDAASGVVIQAAFGHFGAPRRNQACGADDTPVEPVGSVGQAGQGELGVVSKDERSHGQRMADAFVTIARTALDADAAGTTRREPAHVLVVATAEQLADAHTRADATTRREQYDTRLREELQAAYDRRFGLDEPLGPAEPAVPGRPQEAPPVGTEPAAEPSAAEPSAAEPPAAEPPAAEPAVAKPEAEPEKAVRQVPEDVVRFDRAVGLAEIARAGPVSPDVLARITCDSLLQTVVLGKSGEVLDLGRTQRTASRAQRRALAARDGGCVVAGCPAPASDCDSHHRVAWAAGGRTDLADLVLLCQRHHTEVHLGLHMVVLHDGLPYVVSTDPVRREAGPPRRGRQAITAAQRLAQQLRLDLDPPDAPAA